MLLITLPFLSWYFFNLLFVVVRIRVLVRWEYICLHFHFLCFAESRSIRMHRCCCAAHDMHYFPTFWFQVVGNKRAVTAPPHGFWAHECGGLFLRQGCQLQKRIFIRGSFHVIGITSEPGAFPNRMGCIGNRFSPSAQIRHRKIFNLCRCQWSLQRIAVKLWKFFLAGKAAYVCQCFDVKVGEHFQKVIDALGGMTDSPDTWNCFGGHNCKKKTKSFLLCFFYLLEKKHMFTSLE